MANQRDDILYTVRRWQKTERKTGVILHISAYDKENEEWLNARVYVPFPINVAEDKREATTIAKFARDDAAGARGCWLHIPVEFVPKPKEEAKEKKPKEEAKAKTKEKKPKEEAKAKTVETLEDGGIPF